MALRISQVGNDQFFDQNGFPAVGYKLFVYAEGTTTKVDSFTDSAGLAKHTNPIILNAMGYPPAPIFLDVVRRYKLVFTGPLDSDPPLSALYTWDGLGVGLQIDLGAGAEFVNGPFPVFVSGTSFQVIGDLTATLTAGRRVRLTGGAGTILGTVTGSTFGAGVTVVTIKPDLGLLDPSISSFSYGMLSASQGSVPNSYFNGLTTNFVGPVNFPVDQAINLIPASIIFEFAGTIAPPGYALCFGQSLARASFPGLFAAIGTAFGFVDGLSFNVPDLRGAFPLGRDNMGGTPAGRVTVASLNGSNAVTIGGRGGEEAHALTIPELAAHTHTYNAPSGQVVSETGAPQVSTFSTNPATPTGSTGSGTPHNTMPPWLCMNYIIRLF